MTTTTTMMMMKIKMAIISVFLIFIRRHVGPKSVIILLYKTYQGLVVTALVT